MLLKTLIVEQLDSDGTLKTFRMKPASSSDEIVVAFAREYDEPRDGPFHFLEPADAERFRTGFAECRVRRLGLGQFSSSGTEQRCRVEYSGIPTKRGWLSYYALSLPVNAIPH